MHFTISTNIFFSLLLSLLFAKTIFNINHSVIMTVTIKFTGHIYIIGVTVYLTTITVIINIITNVIMLITGSVSMILFIHFTYNIYGSVIFTTVTIIIAIIINIMIFSFLLIL